MLHSVVIDAEALAALDPHFAATGVRLPRSAVVDRTHGRDWHAIPIDEASIAAILNLSRDPTTAFNDLVRDMLHLPPLTRTSAVGSSTAAPIGPKRTNAASHSPDHAK